MLKSTAGRSSSVLLVALLIAFSGCASVKEAFDGMDKPTARVVGVNLAGLDAQSVTLDFDVEVLNPYSVALPVLGLDYQLASAGSQFLSGESNQGGSIPANGRKVLPVSAKVSFLETLNLVQGLRPGAVVPYDADLGIRVDAPAIGPMRLPVSRQGEFPIPTVPKVSINDFKWESLGLSGATALVDLQILNTNDFPIDLSKLAYALSLGDTPIVESSMAQKTSFAKGAARSLPLKFSFKPSSLGLAAFRMLSGSGAPYGLSGDMDLDTPFGPLKMPYSSAGTTQFSGN